MTVAPSAPRRGTSEATLVVVLTVLNGAVAWTVLRVAGWDGTGTELALRTTARVSFVYFLLAFVASPLDWVWPGRVSRWLVRRRRVLGVLFGLSMSIHVLCIVRLFALYAPRRPPMVTLADFFVGIPGLLLVASMTVTSLDALRRRLGPWWWGRLHRTGLWTVWTIFFLCLVDSVGRKVTHHPTLEYHAFIALLLAALALRMAAWATSPGRRPAEAV
jgi:DMSO/TMAO reductase YedYZ heme-binding membrane subunit